jgi:transcription-repair coupling factor (superfamily II helicase)
MRTLPLIDLRERLEAAPPFRTLLDTIRADRFPIELSGVEGGFHAFIIAALAKTVNGSLPVLVPTEKEAESLVADLELLDCPAEVFPWWGSIPYREISLRAPVFGARASALARIVDGRSQVVVIPQRSFLSPLPPPDYFKARMLHLRKGGSIDTMDLARRLESSGYLRVPQVSVHGEFALRGEVLDLYMPGEEDAVRIVFDFDRIEGIKLFSPGSQTSTGALESVDVIPMKEVIWDDERIDALTRNLASFGEFPTGGEAILRSLVEKREAKGEELFFPLAFDEPACILDYFPPEIPAAILEYERLLNSVDALKKEYDGLFHRARLSDEVPSPDRILLDQGTMLARCQRKLVFRTMAGEGTEGAQAIKMASDPPRSFFGNITYLKEEIQTLVNVGYRIYIFAESETQGGRIEQILKDLPIHIIPEGISAGFSVPALKLFVVQENEIFGRKRHIPKSVKHAQSKVIDTFVELNPGDFVVHVNYGIGLFKGIERIKSLGNERDYIHLEYADEESVFLPIEQVNLIQRYIGADGTLRLDKIGGKGWENRKNKVKKSVEDLAERLVQLYSRRKLAKGFAYPKDTEWQVGFEAAFPFEETEDQLRCIEEIKADMESTQPMDRMVCGDVGYGKTEVAMRACFKAVMGGKQVAFLAPTTILVEQHFESFQDRFRNFPIRIEMMSRLVPKPEQKKILAKLKAGEIDIVIGTHRILQKDLLYRDLGLLVIDEEQRFGVKDKERLKEMKTNVDCLTLTATPIPRTLHMSLLKIRDMSVLKTPPSNRHPIETFISEFSPGRVAEAIRKEVARGGQVFYLHNRVESLDDTRIFLQNLVPEMMIETAHGQMDPQDLEDIMHRFIHGGFHVLVSTTIVENGIDIPNVNTIIIDRADMYGVSQLYQLRGRVGRSDKLAYAFLFYPENRALSEIAMKRLQIISDFTELGSGFKIAMKDMEVRGAGNLLGREQSGEIFAVGFDMYLRLLDEAVARLSDSNYEPENEVYLELEYSGFIPDSYIQSATTKMEVYKKVAGITESEELERVYAELTDRFGPIPDEVQSLLSLAEIRILCKNLSIVSLKEHGGTVEVEFGKVARVSVDRVVRMMKESAGSVKLDPFRPNVLMLKTGSIGLKEKSEFIRERIAALAVS